MKRPGALICGLALLGMASGSSPSFAKPLMMPLCGASGQVRLVAVPLGDSDQPERSGGDCAKACHFGTDRKRSGRRFEAEQ